MHKGADDSERTQYAGMAQSIGTFGGISADWIHWFGDLAQTDVWTWRMGRICRDFYRNVLCDLQFHSEYENSESDAQ